MTKINLCRPRDNQSTETVKVTPITRSIPVSQTGGAVIEKKRMEKCIAIANFYSYHVMIVLVHIQTVIEDIRK